MTQASVPPLQPSTPEERAAIMELTRDLVDLFRAEPLDLVMAAINGAVLSAAVALVDERAVMVTNLQIGIKCIEAMGDLVGDAAFMAAQQAHEGHSWTDEDVAPDRKVN